MSDTLVKTGSKVVTLKRQYTFVEEANQDPEVKEYFDMAFKALGAYSRSAGGPPASGLSRMEEQAIMPEVLGVYPSDGRKEFKDSVDNFFRNMNTKVPPEGVPLEIGLENPELKVGFMAIDEKTGGPDVDGPINMPIEPMEYIRYRHAIGNPMCAPNKDEADKYQHIKFYIEDSEAIVQSKGKLNKLEDKAMKIYYKIVEERAKIDQVLTLLGVPNAKKLDPDNAELTLKGKCSIDSTAGEDTNRLNIEKFINVATDKELAVKYDIMQFVSAGIMEQVGNRILIKDSGDEIGVNLKDAAKWMQDKGNVQLIGALKAQLEEFGGSQMASFDAEE